MSKCKRNFIQKKQLRKLETGLQPRKKTVEIPPVAKKQQELTLLSAK